MSSDDNSKTIANGTAQSSSTRGVGARRENGVALPTVSIPKNGFVPESSQRTPKTPADEGIEFFEAAFVPGERPIQVYELKLNAEGKPGKDKSVRTLLLHSLLQRSRADHSCNIVDLCSCPD